LNNPTKFLVVIAGPTAIGKTALSIQVAKHFKTEIISADSRQFYREMKIGTAMPDENELKEIPHHFIGHLSITENYNAGKFENDALSKLEELFTTHSVVIMTGGSGLFIDAVCEGFDAFEDIPPGIRATLNETFAEKGLAWLQEEVKKYDPFYFSSADIKNPHRLLRALEVSIATGKPFSSFKSGAKKERPFKIIKILLDDEREKIYMRINERTEQMMKNGWLNEAMELYPMRNYNALNTVGYKELFSYFDGLFDLKRAVELIMQNTRRYAKRQLTWFRKDHRYKSFRPNEKEKIISFIENEILD
jgi:tRNA dimethylallyltransferase